MATVLDMSISLDGFIAGPNVRPDNALGDGGEVLHAWVMPAIGREGPAAEGADRLGGANGRVFGEAMATGAVIAGRPTFEPAGGWGGDHHDGVPIFIVTRDPGGLEDWPLVTYLDDVGAAFEQARAAAADRDVLVHGAALARLALEAGLLDEVELHVVPVLLGDGLPLFGGVTTRLELTRVLEGEDGIVHQHYRVSPQN